jgi:diguanylate cyclase (GGDEF)-like protein
MLTYNDVTDLVRRAAHFEKLATLDGVTGICNRRHFDLLADAEWNRFQRYHRPLSLVLFDLDHFKRINDEFGHSAGDQTLKKLGTILTQEKRSSDIVARLGGDEFAALLPETDLQQAHLVAQRFHRLIAERCSLRQPGGSGLAVKVSIGIASASASMSGVGALIRLADKALYEAKTGGRNCIKLLEDLGFAATQAAAE